MYIVCENTVLNNFLEPVGFVFIVLYNRLFFLSHRILRYPSSHFPGYPPQAPLPERLPERFPPDDRMLFPDRMPGIPPMPGGVPFPGDVFSHSAADAKRQGVPHNERLPEREVPEHPAAWNGQQRGKRGGGGVAHGAGAQ